MNAVAKTENYIFRGAIAAVLAVLAITSVISVIKTISAKANEE